MEINNGRKRTCNSLYQYSLTGLYFTKLSFVTIKQQSFSNTTSYLPFKLEYCEIQMIYGCVYLESRTMRLHFLNNKDFFFFFCMHYTASVNLRILSYPCALLKHNSHLLCDKLEQTLMFHSFLE